MGKVTVKKLDFNSLMAEWVADQFHLYLDDLNKFSGLKNYQRDLEGRWQPDFRVNWPESEDRSVLVISILDEAVGFAMLKHYSPVDGVNWDHEVSEFYIIPKKRGQLIGRSAVRQIFSQFPGQWKVSMLGDNKPAYNFWYKLISDNFKYELEEIEGGKYLIFYFQASATSTF